MNTPNRRLTFSVDGDKLIIGEKVRWLPPGCVRHKWEESRVAMTVEELERALVFAKGKGTTI